MSRNSIRTGVKTVVPRCIPKKQTTSISLAVQQSLLLPRWISSTIGGTTTTTNNTIMNHKQQEQQQSKKMMSSSNITKFLNSINASINYYTQMTTSQMNNNHCMFLSTTAAIKIDNDEYNPYNPTGELFENNSNTTNTHNTDYSSSLFCTNDEEIKKKNNEQFFYNLIGKKGCIQRTFSPTDNINLLLLVGGEYLAKYSSFDPNYIRAQDWIRTHAIGSAVLNPIVLYSLIGTVTTAAFSNGIIVHQSTTQYKPLIVSVPIYATIIVTSVTKQQQQQQQSSEHSSSEQSSLSEQPSLSKQQQNQIDSTNTNKNTNQKEVPFHYNNNNNTHSNGYIIQLKSIITRCRDDEIIMDGTVSVWLPDYENM